MEVVVRGVDLDEVSVILRVKDFRVFEPRVIYGLRAGSSGCTVTKSSVKVLWNVFQHNAESGIVRVHLGVPDGAAITLDGYDRHILVVLGWLGVSVEGLVRQRRKRQE